MGKISKIASALAVSAAISLGVAGAAFANVVFESYELTVSGTGEYTASDLFGNFKNVMPGDSLDQAVDVTNGGDKTVKVYLRAEGHNEADNPLTYDEATEEADGKDQGQYSQGEGQRDETVASMQDFLAQMSMTVMVGGAEIFNDVPYLESGLAENVYLGELEPGETLQLDVLLQVSIEMGNEYANRVGEVDWVFTIEEIEQPLPNTGGGSNLSKTGDDMPVLMLAGLALTAGIACIVAFVFVKRSRRENR